MTNQHSDASYEGKILGFRNYESDKDEFFSSDFNNAAILLGFLHEVSEHESDVTPAGISYLKYQLDLEQLAKDARECGIALPPYGRGKTDEERIGHFLTYIETLEPMETALFTAESRWIPSTDTPKPTLNNINEALLPPSDTLSDTEREK